MSGKPFTLITGRTTKQGRSIHLGKEAKEFLDEISTLVISQKDIDALRLKEGDQVRLTTRHGSAVARFRKGDIPEGLVFVAYGGFVNSLVGDDTQATGMPNTKGIEVEVERYG